jgi:hypothetical protein
LDWRHNRIRQLHHPRREDLCWSRGDSAKYTQSSSCEREEKLFRARQLARRKMDKMERKMYSRGRSAGREEMLDSQHDDLEGEKAFSEEVLHSHTIFRFRFNYMLNTATVGVFQFWYQTKSGWGFARSFFMVFQGCCSKPPSCVYVLETVSKKHPSSPVGKRGVVKNSQVAGNDLLGEPSSNPMSVLFLRTLNVRTWLTPKNFKMSSTLTSNNFWFSKDFSKRPRIWTYQISLSHVVMCYMIVHKSV